MKRKPTKAKIAQPKPPVQEGAVVVVELVETPVSYVRLRVSGVLDENSVAGFFARVEAVKPLQAKRVLVDLRECRVVLSISDMHGLVKLVAGAFVGSMERLALVLHERDILAEKFFEPALTSRGLPTLATTDPDDALDWLSAKLRPGR